MMNFKQTMSLPNWQSVLLGFRSGTTQTAEEARESFCQMNDLKDGIHRHDDNTYWFYDETGADEFGGYVTFEEANISAKRYGDWLIGPTTE